MTFSMRRFSAIFRKEMRDFKSNSQVLMMIGVPVLFAIIYGQAEQFRGVAANLTVIMALVFIGGFVQAMMIAEEKEKHTLRVLMLSPASSAEVLIGKSFLTGITTIVVCFTNLLILDKLEGNIVLLFFIFLLGTILFNLIGTCIGLLAQNVPQTSLIGMPILFIFLLSDLLEMFVKNESLKKVFQYLPTKSIGEAMNSVIQGKGFSVISGNVLNISIWLVAALVICLFLYKKKQLD
ncbi:ABC transporter permease [Bacillus gaemokensis]|uniref:ABC transporter permease n=1 Tax=Bacillus gaemokensis TaxID=574375 RepID=A0A073KG48_9BACI|nr:ABC transporter permease [Bacillus gaemokensis]KEK25461.1 ABC transporter permease [Bacillus gaemokensis]KYG37094.1 ABC transporter permease [Bacillus gaemokensis]